MTNEQLTKLNCGMTYEIYIDYYMLRAWYRFIHEFLIPYRERASERYGIKNSWIKTISGS